MRWDLRAPTWALMLALASLYLLLVLPDAFFEPWRTDEFFSRNLALQTPQEIIQRTAGDRHPPLYYLLLRLTWNALSCPWVWRGASVAAGGLTVLATFFLGARLRNRRFGFAWAALLCLLPLFIYYAKEVRMYGFSGLWTTGFLLAWSWRPHRPKLAWGGFVLTGTLAAYTHNFCLITLGMLGACETGRWLLHRQTAGAGRRASWVLSGLFAVGLLYLPWLLSLKRQLESDGLADAFDPPTVSGLLRDLLAASFWIRPAEEHTLIQALPGMLLLGAAPGICLALRNVRLGESKPMKLSLVVGWMPLVFLITVSLVWRPVLVLDRHSIMFLPFMILPAAALLQRLIRSRIWASLGWLMVLMLGVHGIRISFAIHNFDYTRIRNLAFEAAHPDEPVLAFPPKYQFASRRWMLSADNRDPSRPPAPLDTAIPRCVLVVMHDTPGDTSRVRNRLWSTLAGRVSAKAILDEPNVQIYRLTNIPDGLMKSLLERPQPEERRHSPAARP